MSNQIIYQTPQQSINKRIKTIDTVKSRAYLSNSIDKLIEQHEVIMENGEAQYFSQLDVVLDNLRENAPSEWTKFVIQLLNFRHAKMQNVEFQTNGDSNPELMREKLAELVQKIENQTVIKISQQKEGEIAEIKAKLDEKDKQINELTETLKKTNELLERFAPK